MALNMTEAQKTKVGEFLVKNFDVSLLATSMGTVNGVIASRNSVQAHFPMDDPDLQKIFEQYADALVVVLEMASANLSGQQIKVIDYITNVVIPQQAASKP